MPIAHIHSPRESIILPLESEISDPNLIHEFRDRQASLTVCEPGSFQDITPSCWPDSSAGALYTLEVGEDGERGVITALIDPETDLSVISYDKDSLFRSAKKAPKFIIGPPDGSNKWVIEYQRRTLIPVRHIGGLVLHVEPDTLDWIRGKFPLGN
jgi:hypothetical protein